MGISGCTSCQAGGVEALRAYDQAVQVKRNDEVKESSQRVEIQPIDPGQASSENRPIADAAVGSIINISA